MFMDTQYHALCIGKSMHAQCDSHAFCRLQLYVRVSFTCSFPTGIFFKLSQYLGDVKVQLLQPIDTIRYILWYRVTALTCRLDIIIILISKNGGSILMYMYIWHDLLPSTHVQ